MITNAGNLVLISCIYKVETSLFKTIRRFSAYVYYNQNTNMVGKFKANDRVQLISGSHTMTVVGHAKAHTPDGDILLIDKYECSWFDGVKSQKAVFNALQIKLIQRLL